MIWETERSQLSLFPLVTIPPVGQQKRFTVGVLRFAGHETFACRATWLHKGLNLVQKEGNYSLHTTRSSSGIRGWKEYGLGHPLLDLCFSVDQRRREINPSISVDYREFGRTRNRSFSGKQGLTLAFAPLSSSGRIRQYVSVFLS